ncbi:AI-2E family transporter [Rhodopila sp.]|uniref:AI-2E family transporter n=1 Tax=Rhodopila sp. TaxID=2480087 RepID=UPI003D1010FF
MISQPEYAADRLVRTLRAIAIAAFIVLATWALAGLLLTIFTAVMLAVMLRGVSDGVARRTGAPPLLMLAAVSLLFVVLLLAFLFYLAPRVVDQVQDLWGQLSQIIADLRHSYDGTRWGHLVLDHLQQGISSVGNHVAGYATDVAATTFSGLARAFVVIVTALYLAVSPALYVNGAVRLFPLRHRDQANRVLIDLGRTLQWWSLGQLIDMAVVGVLSSVGLSLLGVPLPIALGALAGLLTFIPYLGAIAASIPAALVAMTVSWQTALWTLVVFLCCHVIEGYILAPIVQRRTVNMPPALTVLAMTILGALFGPLGVILGTPIAVVALVTTREIYVGEMLGDPEIAGPRGADSKFTDPSNAARRVDNTPPGRGG